MTKKRIIIVAAVVAVLLTCLIVGLWLGSRPGDDQPTQQTTGSTAPEVPETTTPTLPEDPVEPTDPTDPTEPTEPTDPSDPTEPTDPTDPTDPTEPTQPQAPEVDPNLLYKTEILVTCQDGSAARGAAVIATHSSGRQEYEPTNEDGLAVLHLPEGTHTLRVFRDGQHGTLEVEVKDEPQRKSLQLKDERMLYILLETSGGYDGDPKDLANCSTLVDAIMAQYPNATYITKENHHNVAFRDGDALLTVELLVENYTSNEQYLAGQIFAEFKTYQESITVWDTDEGGEEIESEFIDGSTCSIQVRNDYDYEYRDTVSMVTESYYVIRKDWHLSKYSCRADGLGYGYDQEGIRSTSTEKRIKAPGAGKGLEIFCSDVNATRYDDYLEYVRQVFPFVDLWMTGNWNDEVQDLTAEM